MKKATGQGNHGNRRGALPWALLVCGAVACGPVPEEQVVSHAEFLATQEQAVTSDNGASYNGLAFNGLAFNGLAFNGLAFNGLNSAAFASWYDSNPDLASGVMKYVTACAAPAGVTRTYMDRQGRTRTWVGSLGFAPNWTEGHPATVLEQQLVSACLAAHVNKFGRTVPISVLGRTASNQLVATSQKELQTFSQPEGCFFGNLFTQQGVFVGHNDRPLRKNESSVRACALETGQDGCEPITQVGSCAESCVADPASPSYLRCTYQGTTYAAVTTRIRPEDVYSCGDHVCQFTESAGVGVVTERCALDCGLM